jgi:hypothetical protein
LDEVFSTNDDEADDGRDTKSAGGVVGVWRWFVVD